MDDANRIPWDAMSKLLNWANNRETFEPPLKVTLEHLVKVSDLLAESMKNRDRESYCFIGIVRLLYLGQDQRCVLNSDDVIKILLSNNFAKQCVKYHWTRDAGSALCELLFIIIKKEGHSARRKFFEALIFSTAGLA